MWWNKRKTRRCSTIGLKDIASLGKLLIQLDRQLVKYGIRVGAHQTADLDIHGGKILSMRLTVYFTVYFVG